MQLNFEWRSLLCCHCYTCRVLTVYVPFCHNTKCHRRRRQTTCRDIGSTLQSMVGQKVRVSRDLWPWHWPWAHPGCTLTWRPSCASLVAILPFAFEKKRFSCRHKSLPRDVVIAQVCWLVGWLVHLSHSLWFLWNCRSNFHKFCYRSLASCVKFIGVWDVAICPQNLGKSIFRATIVKLRHFVNISYICFEAKLTELLCLWWTFTVDFGEVVVKLRGQDCHSESLKTTMARPWFVISSPDWAIRPLSGTSSFVKWHSAVHGFFVYNGDYICVNEWIQPV